MREIKFRTWHEDTKYFYVDTGLTSLGLNDAINKALDAGYILEQYTGFKDRTGKEIYEGDILDTCNDGSDGCDIWEFGDYEKLTVKWNEEYYCFRGVPYKSGVSVYCEKYIKIIGNIHE